MMGHPALEGLHWQSKCSEKNIMVNVLLEVIVNGNSISFIAGEDG